MPDPTASRDDDVLDALVEEQPSAMPSSISVSNIVWPILLSMSVLAVIGYFTFDLEDFKQMMVSINPWLMLAAFGTVATRIFFGGWRLSYISHSRLTLSLATRGQVAWDFCSNVTPSLVGGAPLTAVYIVRDSKIHAKEPATPGEVTAFMMFIMVLDQIWFALSVPVVLVASLYMDVIPTSFGSVGLWSFVLYFVLFMVWTVIFTYATLVRPSLLQSLTDRIFRLKFLRRFQDRVAQEVHEYRNRARIIRSQPPSFYVKGLLLTAGTWLSRYFLMVFVVWAVYADLDVVLFFMRVCAMTLGTLIMPTPGGAGGIEGLYALFLGPMMPSSFVAPTLLIWRFLGYYIFILFGVFLMSHQVQQSMIKRTKLAEHQETKASEAKASEAPEETPEPVQ